MPSLKSKFSKRLFSTYENYRLGAFSSRHFQPDAFQTVVDEIVNRSGAIITAREIGRSWENRSVRLFSMGRGKTNVLLWSQMHGDESTATMAIADILNYLSGTTEETGTKKILSALSLHFVPILNPDGAARTMRRTAQGIDMNRDAFALVTPEARILRGLQKKLRPRFGFNLHDQELSTVGTSRTITAIGLLAPAFDEARRDNAVRTRAKRLSAVFAESIAAISRGAIARYDDTFEPRAFGDTMQKWGTSTLLVESGHAVNDPEKQFIRKLNFIGILSCLYAIAMGEDRRARIDVYESLPFNGKKAYDVIIRNVMIDHGEGRQTKGDLGISSQVDTHSEPPPKLVDIGDLSTFAALKDIDGRDSVIPQSHLLLGAPVEWNWSDTLERPGKK